MTDLATRLQAACLARGLHVVTVESCTGGLVGAAITAIPGSSAYYLGGLITYSNDVKRDLAGVPQALLDAHGAVSAQVAVGDGRWGPRTGWAPTSRLGDRRRRTGRWLGREAGRPDLRRGGGRERARTSGATSGPATELRTRPTAPMRRWSWRSSG